MKVARIAIMTAALALGLEAQPEAKNVVLIFGDGVGLTSLSAASLHGYKEPQKLFLQSMPNMAWADTSSLSHWVTDAGAAATAVATGSKTANRMVSTFLAPSGKPREAASPDFSPRSGKRPRFVG